MKVCSPDNVKYHIGDHRGQKVWILGIVEGSSHRITLYPVNSRDEDTLIHIIEPHVAKGTMVYTDGWRVYQSLNDRGYRHFTVEQNNMFTQTYTDLQTEELKTDHTNTIQGNTKDMCRKFVDGLYYDGNEMFSGEVEIDESLFSRRCKYHKGDPRGQKEGHPAE